LPAQELCRPVNTPSAKVPEWLVYRLGGPKVTLLGTVVAADMGIAFARAFKEFNITPAGRKRVILHKVGEA
jgi:hypothetical protein